MHVEIWSDIACPWCAIGKRRFAAALERFGHRDEVRVTWRSFELDPGAPAEREGDRTDHLARKYGVSREQAQRMHDQMTEVAAAEGVTFRFDIARSANTFDAHRLLHLAAAHGAQDALGERLFRAHLGEGELISDHATLERLAVEAGLPADEVREVLATDAFADAVRDDEKTGAALGISGVPFFAIDRRLGLSGAQDPEVILEGLRRGWESRSPMPVVTGGEACGPDGC